MSMGDDFIKMTGQMRKEAARHVLACTRALEKLPSDLDYARLELYRRRRVFRKIIEELDGLDIEHVAAHIDMLESFTSPKSD